MDEIWREWGRNIEAGMVVVGIKSHRELAERIGVRQQSVTRWINGQNAPRDRHKVLVARVLQQEVARLFPLNRGVAA